VTKATHTPAGFLSITLHAHLPWVINHGTWPHGIEWLHEAAAETYLPLLRVLASLERDGVPANFNLSLSPILLEQLAHPVFIAEFPKYVTRKIVAAREDEAFFIQAGEAHLAATARFWHRFFSTALDDFRALDGKIVSGFRRFQEAGLIEILTSGATHGYLPLLGTDESVRAQVRTAVETHIRHLGRAPRGIWAPECGYRPAGHWEYPVGFAGEAAGVNGSQPGFARIGVEQALSESSIAYFFVDTHLVEESQRVASPYDLRDDLRDDLLKVIPARTAHGAQRNLYQPYFVDGPYRGLDQRDAASVFPRDPRTGLQVWSGDTGYPGDVNYLDFHKKRFPGGHRYWQVTGHPVDIGDKLPYWPQQAAERVKTHAGHFVHLIREALHSSFNASVPPILSAPFDAELFGHWWFEGPMWLEAVCRALHNAGPDVGDPDGEATDSDTPDPDAVSIATITSSQYLERYPRAGFIAMHEGSWGAEGNNQVWLNPETSWTYAHLYPAELYLREVATAGLWRDSCLGLRIVQQLCRELLLLESSDWQFLITTGAARDYAEMRFLTHHDQFLELKAIWQAFGAHPTLNEHQTLRLAEIELRDNIFPGIDPALWAAGAQQTRRETAVVEGVEGAIDPTEPSGAV
jgi:1,4-alpha-glucan branching enzyme